MEEPGFPTDEQEDENRMACSPAEVPTNTCQGWMEKLDTPELRTGLAPS